MQSRIHRTNGRRMSAAIARTVFVALLAASITETTHAQPPTRIDGWKLHISDLIARQLKMCRPQIIAGRLAVMGDGGTRGSGTSISRDGVSERFSLSMAGAVVSLQYDRTSAEGRFVFDLQEGGGLSIRCEPMEASVHAAWSVVHPARESLQWRLTTSGRERALEAESLWELLAAEPEWTRAMLIPRLIEMFPDWNLGDEFDRVQSELMALAGKKPAPVPDQWMELVEDLGAKKFSEREAAQRQLTAAGRDVIPFLKELPDDKLDAEQRFRIRAILTDLAGGDDDRPEVVAEALAPRPLAWLGLLASDDLARRIAALAQLRELTSEPIDFDPVGTSDERAKQLEYLRGKFAPPPADEQPINEGDESK